MKELKELEKNGCPKCGNIEHKFNVEFVESKFLGVFYGDVIKSEEKMKIICNYCGYIKYASPLDYNKD